MPQIASLIPLVAVMSSAASASGLAQPTVEITVVDRRLGTNSSITGTIGALLIGKSLDTVSELYLSSTEAVQIETVTCTPYKYTDGTGRGGLPFTEGNPSYLSTNTVVVGSIYCSSSQILCDA